MKPTSSFPIITHRTYISILVLILSSLACGLGQPKVAPTQTPASVNVVPTKAPVKTQVPTATTSVNTGLLVRQWASAGEATSEYGSYNWSAQQAAGAPDTFTCGDSVTAWASAESDTVESITLYYYETPLIPTEINIVQSYNPSQVVKVELLDPYGEFSDAIVYETEPKATAECPFTLSIPVTGIDYLVMGVRITIDQSVLGLGWNEIDAVELVGYPETGFEPQPTSDGLPAGIWENVYALPIYPSADTVNYLDDYTLLYNVSSNTRQEVLDFLLVNLEGIGWLLDVDENGNCRNENHCTSKTSGLDYKSADNELWYFIHVESPDAGLMLTLFDSGGVVLVSMSVY